MIKRVAVTGAGGYLGHHVVQNLIDRGIQVTAITRRPDPWLAERLDSTSIIDSDVFRLSPQHWDQLAQSDVLIHLAWRDGFVLRSRAHGSDLSRHYDFLMDASDRGIHRLGVIGTMHEVGYWEGPIGADAPCAPTTEYGIAKDALRRLLTASLTDATTLAWLRLYYIVGDDERSNSVFNKILQADARGDAWFPFTSGTNRYDFVDIDVLAGQIITAMLSDESGIIDCGSGEPTTLASAAERFIRDRGLSIELEYGAFPDRPFDSPGLWADTTRIDGLAARHPKDPE